MVLKASMASMTSKDMIKSLASMTSTASFFQKVKSCFLGDFHTIRNLSSLIDLNSLNDLSGLNDLNSLISYKKIIQHDVAINLATK